MYSKYLGMASLEIDLEISMETIGSQRRYNSDMSLKPRPSLLALLELSMFSVREVLIGSI